MQMRETDIASARNGETVIEGIDWQINPGEFWVVGGLHGSGKTDLLMTAAGLQRPARGVVSLFGKDTNALHEAEMVELREQVGLVFENGGRLFAHLTAAENIALPLRYHRNWDPAQAEASVAEICDAMQLTEMAEEYPASLSTSWRQRVALARSLVLKPSLILMDKPLIGLRHRKWWVEFLKKLTAEGKSRMTVVITTEDFSLWSGLASHFALLKNNRWQVLGGKAELESIGQPLLMDENLID